MKFDLVSFFLNDPRSAFNILYPQAVLRAAGHSCTTLFLFRNNRVAFHLSPQAIPTNNELELMVEKLRKADLVGISVCYTYLEAAKRLTARIKERLKAPVIWGGWYPTMAPEECIEYADMLCIGEGEETVVELANTLSAGKDISAIRNLWIKRNGLVIKNQPRSLCENLDVIPNLEFPRPDAECISCDSKTNYCFRDSIYNILASRGCLSSCTFCGEYDWRRCCNVKTNYRLRSPEKVVAELEKAKNHPLIKRVVFTDAMFPPNAEWIKEFSWLYKKRVGLPFSVRFNPAYLKKTDVVSLVDAGLDGTIFSIESGSERIRRKVFNKQVSNAQILAAHAIFRDTKKFNLQYNLLVDNPWETEQDKQDAFDLLMKLDGRLMFKLNTLIFYPKHELTEKSLQAGLINQYHLMWALRPRPNYLHTFYKRKNNDVFWIMLLLLIDLHSRYHCFPKKLILLVNKNAIFRRYPGPAFYLIYYTSRLLFYSIEGKYFFNMLYMTTTELFLTRIRRCFAICLKVLRRACGVNECIGGPDEI